MREQAAAVARERAQVLSLLALLVQITRLERLRQVREQAAAVARERAHVIILLLSLLLAFLVQK